MSSKCPMCDRTDAHSHAMRLGEYRTPKEVAASNVVKAAQAEAKRLKASVPAFVRSGVLCQEQLALIVLVETLEAVKP